MELYSISFNYLYWKRIWKKYIYTWITLLYMWNSHYIVNQLWKWKWESLSRVRLFVTPWTVQSVEFSRPEHWSGLSFPSPGDLPNPGIKPRSSTLQVDSLPAEPPGKPLYFNCFFFFFFKAQSCDFFGVPHLLLHQSLCSCYFSSWMCFLWTAS